MSDDQTPHRKLAVALEYEKGTRNAPRVTAKGYGLVAEAIVARAMENDVVVDTNAVVLRSGPGRAYRDLVAVPRGEELTVSDPPIRADGHDWYGVQHPDYGAGWAAGTYLSPA